MVRATSLREVEHRERGRRQFSNVRNEVDDRSVRPSGQMSVLAGVRERIVH
jgi:hypothetical protein